MISPDVVQIRDPIHGAIKISKAELLLIDHLAFQRLRNIKQLGFADLAFPGATHSRYSHSLGALHLASRVFHNLAKHWDLPKATLEAFLATVRLAMLFHDVGHAPLSHTTEQLMPSVKELGLDAHFAGDTQKRATHEHYTLKILLDSPLSEQIAAHFGSFGISPQHVAALIADEAGPLDFFKHNGLDFLPVLRQIVTSECDADRMDYLQRDSFFCGVNYGKFDADWLIDNVVPVQQDGRIYLGIRSRAVFSFEDFLLSRYHMFVSVYLHHTPVIFEQMLSRYFQTSDDGFGLPSDIEKYIQLDDMDLWHTLRRSKNPWAKRIVARRPYYLLDESKKEANLGPGYLDHSALCAQLKLSGVEPIRTRTRNILSKYYGNEKIPMYVVTGAGQVVNLDVYTPLYERYQNPAEIQRLYIDPKDKTVAQKVLSEFVQKGLKHGQSRLR